MSVLPSQTLPMPEVYYDSNRGNYWDRDAKADWFQLNEASLKRHLKAASYCPKPLPGKLISELEEVLNRLQKEQNVAYAGPLAGYSKGIHEVCGNRILVTTSPKFIEPVVGEWPIIDKILSGMLNLPEKDQTPYFFGWLKLGINALRSPHGKHGQALALVGPHGCAKSLTQNLIITPLFGGRSAKPFQVMTGLTAFNSDLFEAEHLMIEDESPATDIRARRTLGAQLKNITVNTIQRHHQKNKSAISLTPRWRLSLTLNDEAENLMVLPPIDDSIEDKLMLLKVAKQPMPMPTNTPEEQEAFQKAIAAELPAFSYFLLNWQIPDELRSQRFGITHYHHPDLLQSIDELAPEFRLLSLIDVEIFTEFQIGPWEGTAEKLQRELSSNESNSAYEARKLLGGWSSATGVYLARLAKKVPERISERRIKGVRMWTINPK